MTDLDEFITSIREREERREEAGQSLSDADLELDGRVLLQDAEPASLDGLTIAGVDGGFARKEYHGYDALLLRAVAALFTYDEDGLETSRYLPEGDRRPDYAFPAVRANRREVEVSTQLLRLRKEVAQARAAVEEGADMVLLDGSVVPQYTDKPSQDDPMRQEYDDLIDLYQELFELAEENGAIVAGVIEDSRSSAFCERIGDLLDRFPTDAKDTNVLEYALEYGERTCHLDYAEEYEKHQILRDLGEYGDAIYNFYMRTARNARPVRVDIIAPEDPAGRADRVASLLLPLCSYSANYGIPSVIMDADQRAKIEGSEVERFESRVRAELGPVSGMEDLRRNQRPF